MLHFGPIDPLGQVESMPNVHSCEHTGVGNMLKAFVHGLPMHSLELSVTVVQGAPNDPGAGPSPPASAAGDDELLEQADRTRARASTKRCMVGNVTVVRHPIAAGSCDRDVTLHDLAITGSDLPRVTA